MDKLTLKEGLMMDATDYAAGICIRIKQKKPLAHKAFEKAPGTGFAGSPVGPSDAARGGIA
jgi:hypothetical protein